MISHDRAQELISARMDAPLTAAEHRDLNAHLASCDSCRVFVAGADDLARGLQVMPRLAPSQAVSRAVMAAIATEQSSWGWLRGALQALASPGMAVASGFALIVALAGAMFIAMNAPGGGGDGNLADSEATVAAVANQPLPTEVPTEAPAPEPTPTVVQPRAIVDSPTRAPAETPAPRPTATRVPIVAARSEPTESPVIETAVIEQPIIEPVSDGELAMAPEPDIAAENTTDLAQAAEPVQTGEEATQAEAAPEAAPAEGEFAAEAAPEGDDGGNGRRGDGGRKDDGGEAAPEEAAAAEPVATETLPVPDEAIAALESAGESPSDVSLPPAPLLPMPPEQAFLPITPTPVGDGTPTPETESQADAPQLADEWSGDVGVTALIPDVPAEDVVISEPAVTAIENEEITAKEKKDKSSRDGKSHENQQSAHGDGAMGWSMAPIDLLQTAALPQITEDAAVTTPVPAGETTTLAPALQIDPATGLQIDPATGLLIDPVTGYLLDLVNGLVYHPGTGFQVHPITGLLIDPLTGAQLDPVTLAIVIPAGFGTDTPNYDPGDPAMRGQLETNADDLYDDATYKVIPATDGPVQPVGEIIVPTESGEAVEIQ